MPAQHCPAAEALHGANANVALQRAAHCVPADRCCLLPPRVMEHMQGSLSERMHHAAVLTTCKLI